MKKLILLVLSIYLSIGSVLLVYGCGPDTNQDWKETENYESVRRNPSEMTAGEIAKALYWAIPDRAIAAAAKDEVILLTGESVGTDLYGYIKIGQYAGKQVYEHCEMWALLGKENFCAIETDNGYIMLMPYGDRPTAESAIQNKKVLDRLYNAVWDIREATADMGDVETSDYIIQYLRSHLRNKADDASDHIATWFDTGVADCGIYSGLYYLIGSNCGLHIDVINGTIHGESHAWNKVEINGTWNYVDLAYRRFYFSDQEAAAYGYLMK